MTVNPVLESPSISSPSPSSDWLQNNTAPPFFPEAEEKKDQQALKQLLEIYKENIAQSIESEKLPSPKKTIKQVNQENPLTTIPGYFTFLSPPINSATSIICAPRAIPEECFLFLDTLCSELVITDIGPDSTTTLTLEKQELIGTPFYGAKVVIEEYSTAPKIFNVCIKTAQESACSLVQAHAADFLHYIQSKKFSFSINQFHSEYLDDSSSFQENDSSTDPDAEKEKSS